MSHLWYVKEPESLVGDSSLGQLSRVESDVILCGVEDVRHAQLVEVLEVLGGAPAADDDAREHLIAVHA